MRLVNILTSGRIPWIDITGPVFGYPISDGAAQLLFRDPRVVIESTTVEDAKLAKEAYYKTMAPKKEGPAESIAVSDDFNISVSSNSEPEVVATEGVAKTVEDNDIDSILEQMNINTQDDVFLGKDIKMPEAKTVAKKYTIEDLSTMTKRQMKEVLRERGYLEGPNAGKYHDTVDMLIEKIFRTQ